MKARATAKVCCETDKDVYADFKAATNVGYMKSGPIRIAVKRKEEINQYEQERKASYQSPLW
jgi:hypothetical protein